MSVKTDFEEKFMSQIPPSMYGKRIALAVSGGADSVCMLLVSSALAQKFSWELEVVTVNHLIREKSESEGDCIFVKELCSKNNLPCFIINAKVNQIFKMAGSRDKGIEEAARYFRYNEFEKYAGENKCDYVFLAHNKNDQTETLLQRFLQGAIGPSSCGIPKERGIFYRPLLDFSRSEIEAYLEEEKMSFRFDRTNSDNAYFRNRIRNDLIPLLNEDFSGWQTALLHGKEKRELEEDYFEGLLKDVCWKKDGEHGFYLDREYFESFHPALRIRLVYKVLEMISASNRVSYDNIKKFVQGDKVLTCGIEMSFKDSKVFVKRKKNSSTESLLFGIIEK
nr:tRNA lysidine(34) synthetase TilS [Treponemataceae bacterium]